jgi:Chaperone of endosialidase/Pectate lyase superfamily protein/Right handed beta helix region
VGKYRTLGTLFNRVFRNDLNQNFEDIDKDIQTQKKRVDDLIINTPQPSEVVDARGGHPVLRDRLDSVDVQLVRSVDNLNTREINVLFPPDGLVAAVGDGVADDTAAIQAIIDYVGGLGGGKLVIPNRTFLITGSLYIPSNVVIEGLGSASVIRKTNGGYPFQVVGSIGAEIALSADKTSGDTIITTSAAHSLVVNDLVLIKSQRSAFSADAAEDWRLGSSTGGTNAAYYGEFLLVQSVTNDTTFVSSSGLIYPYYYKDNTRETDVNARTCATIQKVNAVRNVKIKDLRIEGNIAGAVNVRYGYNVVTENLDIFVEQAGSGIVFRESFNCYDKGSVLRYDANFTPAEHYDRNPFKVISGQNCGFDGTRGEFATQTFDFTFQDFSIVTTDPYYKNGSTAFSDLNAGTTHGGVYRPVITDNIFSHCRQYGVSVRGRNAIVTDNVIQGSYGGTYSYGVAMYEGYAVDGLVANNQISGFTKGVTHIDGTTSDKFFKRMGTVIANNTIKGANLPFTFDLNANNTYAGASGLRIVHNTVPSFSGQYAKGVTLSGINQAFVAFNEFNDPTASANAGVYISKRGTENIILENEFNGITPHLLVADDLEANIRVIYDTSKNFSQSKITLPATGVTVSKLIYGSQNPVIDNKFALGWSGGRWSMLYAATGTINTSDRNYKQQIGEIPDEWLDAWSEVQYSRFKYNDAVNEKGEDARWHVGLIAQSIQEAFQKQGLDAFEIGLLCYDEWTDEETGETKSMWSIRADECAFMESAYVRRELAKINAKI